MCAHVHMPISTLHNDIPKEDCEKVQLPLDPRCHVMHVRLPVIRAYNRLTMTCIGGLLLGSRASRKLGMVDDYLAALQPYCGSDIAVT